MQQFVQVGPWLMDKDIFIVLITATVTLTAALGGAFVQHFLTVRLEKVKRALDAQEKEAEAKQIEAKEAEKKLQEEQKLLRAKLEAGAAELATRFEVAGRGWRNYQRDEWDARYSQHYDSDTDADDRDYDRNEYRDYDERHGRDNYSNDYQDHRRDGNDDE